MFCQRAWHKKRYAENADYRAKVRATQRRYRETHKDQIRERRRRKWDSDEALRDRQRASNRASQRRKRYQQVYGFSFADYDAMLQRQGSACAICRRSGDALCVDHCHACGKVRGLLCVKCNSALGFCNDSPALLLAAAAYLRAACDHEGTMPMTAPSTAPSTGEACAPPRERAAGNGSFADARHCRCAGKAV